MVLYIRVIAHTKNQIFSKGRDRTMIFNYQEAIARYGTDYKLQKALKKKEIYKIEKGIYSDRANNFTIYELLLKKYPHAVLVKDSAFHFIMFLADEPKKVHLGTARNALRITDKRVQQHFYKDLNSRTTETNSDTDNLDTDDMAWLFSNSKFGISHENIQKYITENNNEIRLFNLKNLLFDLLRDRNKYNRSVLFDLLAKFRDCSIVVGVDNFFFEDEFFNIVYDEELCDMLKEIAERDSDRLFERNYID